MKAKAAAIARYFEIMCALLRLNSCYLNQILYSRGNCQTIFAFDCVATGWLF